MSGIKRELVGSDLGCALSNPITWGRMGGYVEPCIICCFCRIQTYLQSTKPIIDLYEEMGKVKKIDASKSVDEVSIPSLP